MPLGRTTAGASARPHWWDRLSRGDQIALVLFVVLPIALYVPLSISGHPVLPGDDLVQNFPLRVLAGNVIRSGRVPAWDPLIWSGTPLLAGWNGGSLYPATLLFAFLPALTAWTINLVLVPILSSIGSYVLCRRLACRPLAATFGALVFTYTGFMSAQIVHIGLTQGMACVPWMLVAIDALAAPYLGRTSEPGRTPQTTRTTAGYVALLGVAFAATVLAGDPRAITNAVVVAGIYLLACCWRAGRRCAQVLLRSLAGLILGVLCAAVQWLPGLGFLHASQRNETAYAFFGAGSLTPGHLGSLLLLPFLLGGNGNFSLPIYSGSYNLPELTLGVGLVALVAACAFLPQLLASAVDWVRSLAPARRGVKSAPGQPLFVWYVLGLVGFVLTLGTHTPLGHLLVHVPLFGGERLQNRNGAIFDLALAILLGLFAEDLFSRREKLGGHALASGAQSLPLSSWPSRICAMLPAIAAALVVVYAYVKPAALENRLHYAGVGPSIFHAMSPYLIPTAVFAVLLACFCAAAWSLSRRSRVIVLSVLVAFDLATFISFSSFATVPATVVGASTTLSEGVAQATGTTGRFALYNPAFQTPAAPYALSQAGITDLNILHDDASVEGYGSIVDGTYQEATQTHDFQNLDIGRLDGQTFNTLDLRSLLTLPIYFQEPIAPHAAVPIARAPGTDAPSRPSTPTPPNASGPWPIRPSHAQAWLLAAPVSFVRATIYLLPAAGSAPKTLQIGVASPGTTTKFRTVKVSADKALLISRSSFEANTVIVKNTSSARISIGAVVVVTKDPDLRLVLDGALQGTMTAPHWVYSGNVGPFVDFTNTETRGLAWLQPPRFTTPNAADIAPGSIKVLTNSAVAPQVMAVSTPKTAALVRSETYTPGWTARLTPVGGGPTRILTAHRLGLVQAVDVPPGNWHITWRYAPRELLGGIVMSLFGIAVLLVLLAITFWRRNEKRLAASDTAKGGV